MLNSHQDPTPAQRHGICDRLPDSELLALAITFRVPDSAIPAFCLWARDKPFPERHGPVEWEVTFTGKGWAVLSSSGSNPWCLRRDGLWDLQRMPSDRDEEFYRLYRWPSREVALEAACIAARLYPNGHPYKMDEDHPAYRWSLFGDWPRLWEEYHAETERQVKAFAETLP